MRHFTFFSLIYLTTFLSASSIQITGSLKGFEGEFVRLYKVSDFITFKEIKLDVWKVQNDGSFTLNAPFEDDALIRIKVKDISVSLIVPAGKDLNVTLSYNAELNEQKLFDKQFKAKLKDFSDQGINEAIWKFQNDYASFVEQNQQLFVTKQARPAVQEFKDSVMKSVNEDMPDYLIAYLRYSMASLQDAVMASEAALFEEYFMVEKLPMNNLAFVQFFEQFYQDRFLLMSQAKNGIELLAAVNEEGTITSVLEFAQSNRYVQGKELAELFAINGLREVYYEKTFKKEMVLSMLEKFAKSASTPMHRLIARNTIDELTFLQPGQPAPDFNLTDISGILHHLSDFKGKPVMIFFWSSESRASVRQLSVLGDFYANFSNDLVMISICMDETRESAEKLISEMNIDWITVFADRQYDLSDKYRLRSTPSFCLVDKAGEIYKYPASSPELGLSKEIQGLILKD
ncbi:MAG: TlpA disulfide reductase family protein [Vicingaceae bacterium]